MAVGHKPFSNALYENDKGEMVEGIECISLRLDGLKGFFIALAVLIVSISTCGFIANKNGKVPNKQR